MTNSESIDRFMAASALKLPKIVQSRLEKESLREVYPDYALLAFDLPVPMNLEEFCNELDESFGIVEMYRHSRSAATDFG